MEKLTRRQFLQFTATMLAATLAACGAPAPKPVPTPSLPATPTPWPKGDGKVIFPYDDPPWWRSQARKFEEKTGIKVDYQVVPFPQLFTKYQTALLGGERLDVIHVHDLWCATFGSMGLLLPLESKVTKEMTDSYPVGLLDKLSLAGHIIYAIPLYLWVTQFYYRRDIFEKQGLKVPQTFEEMRRMCKELQGVEGKDVYPFLNALGGSASTSMYSIILRGEGGEILTGGKPSFNNEVGITALEEMVGFVKEGSVDPSSFTLNTGTLINDPFAQGKAIMVFGPPPTFTICNDPNKSRVVGKIGYDLMPGGSKQRSATVHETGGRAIPVTSGDPTSAWEYIKFINQPEELVDMAVSLGRIPASLAALNDQRVQQLYPVVKLVPEQLKYPSGMAVVHPKGVEIGKTLADEIVAACQSAKTVKQALTDAEANINKILAG